MIYSAGAVPIPGDRFYRAIICGDMQINFLVRRAAGPSRMVLSLALLTTPMNFYPQRTQKPILYGRHWVAVTGKPIAATAGVKSL